MATNAPPGDGHRNGAVRKRSQLQTKVMGDKHWTKRDKETGQFMDQKADDKKFKGVRREKA
ncbi:MAG TPA: hypothetical protein VHL34_14900 [Rhizomicrobium sp.]|jgi:hypothetical protein|nr:hypothetical protein [Rhizomicrobium sp.]